MDHSIQFLPGQMIWRNLKLANLLVSLIAFFAFSSVTAQEREPYEMPQGSGTWVIVIHGGAGSTTKSKFNPDSEQQCFAKMKEALEAGGRILGEGGSSVDAVETAIRILEDSPLFNAGKGAVLTEEGKVELDASIMDGKTGLAGAVAGVTTIKNPITAAKKVMTNTKHVMLAGKGAEEFARNEKLEIVDPSYFITPERKMAWEEIIKSSGGEEKKDQPAPGDKDRNEKGTVGAVALDNMGNLAAGTSTGGMMMKKYGRIGDSPIIGAGTYAHNQTCAVSATGHGEFFIRNAVAYDVSARMEYLGMPLEEATKTIIMEKLPSQGGTGGLIAIDKDGNISMPFNTPIMYRGYLKANGETEVLAY